MRKRNSHSNPNKIVGKSQKQSKLEIFMAVQSPKLLSDSKLNRDDTHKNKGETHESTSGELTKLKPPADAGNAFQALMKGARDAVPRKETFILNLDQSDDFQNKHCWSWAWSKSDGKQGMTADKSGFNYEPKPIKWRGQQNLKVANSISSSVLSLVTTIQSTNMPVSRQTRLTPSLLKSAMQKNVRLCRATEASIVGKELQGASMIEFLRRLAIIILEDAILHPALPLVVWTLIGHSQKDGTQFHPPPMLASALLAIAADVARVGIRDPIDASEVLSGGSFLATIDSEVDALPPPEQVLSH